MNQNINDSKSHICNSLFWKYYFGRTTLVHTFQWTSSELFLFQNLQHFCSKNYTHFTNLKSFKIENKMLPKHSQKKFISLQIFQQNVSIWCKKKHLHCTISWCPRTTFLKYFESKCLYISAYLSKKFCFKDVATFYLVIWGVGGGWITSLKWLVVWLS